MQEEPVKPVRKGMAIASLVLGILSIPTCGLLGIGSLVGISLGALSLYNISKNPNEYGGKGLAISGIITSVAGLLLIGVSAAIAIPQLNKTLKLQREFSTVATLEALHRAEASFWSVNAKFGTLKELAEQGFLPEALRDRHIQSGYVYTESGITARTFCIHATRLNASEGYKDFNVTEAGVIHSLETKTPTVLPRGAGTPVLTDDSPERIRERNRF